VRREEKFGHKKRFLRRIVLNAEIRVCSLNNGYVPGTKTKLIKTDLSFLFLIFSSIFFHDANQNDEKLYSKRS
jgi:hypothetical protein